MNTKQFEILISEIKIMKKEIIDKLEEVRFGLIDIEDEISKAQDEESGRVRARLLSMSERLDNLQNMGCY